jgi:hypothetical protein
LCSVEYYIDHKFGVGLKVKDHVVWQADWFFPPRMFYIGMLLVLGSSFDQFL